VTQDDGRARGVGYSEEWRRRVVRERGEALSVPPEPERDDY